MELLTKKVERKFKKYPALSQEEKGMDAIVLVKYFDPCSQATWLITEAEPRTDGDWMLYGYIRLGSRWKWGELKLSTLQTMRRPCGLIIKRDIHIDDKATVAELVRKRKNWYSNRVCR